MSLVFETVTDVSILRFKDNNSPQVDFEESEVWKSGGVVSWNTAIAFSVTWELFNFLNLDVL